MIDPPKTCWPERLYTSEPLSEMVVLGSAPSGTNPALPNCSVAPGPIAVSPVNVLVFSISSVPPLIRLRPVLPVIEAVPEIV